MAHISFGPLPGRAGGRSVARTVGPPPMLLRFAAVLVLPLFAYALFATGQKALENYQLAVQAQQARQDIHNLRQENLSLQSQLVAAHSDASVEVIAREQLGLVQTGDHPLIVLNGDGRPTAPPDAGPPPPPAPPAWQQWFDLYFGGTG